MTPLGENSPYEYLTDLRNTVHQSTDFLGVLVERYNQHYGPV